MVRSSYTLTALGFTAILAVLLAVVFISLAEFRSSQAGIEALVTTTGSRTAAIQTMREAVLQHGSSLKNLQLAIDNPEFNQEQQRLNNYLEQFREANLRLANIDLNEQERAILGELQRLETSA